MIAAVSLLVAGGSSSGSSSRASELCDEVSGLSFFQARRVLDGIGEPMNHAVWEKCRGTMLALTEQASEIADIEASPIVYRQQDLVEIGVETCTDEGASGTVTNGNDVKVSVRVEVDFISDQGELLDVADEWVHDLQPRQSWQWETVAFNIAGVAHCDARIDGLFED